MVTVWLTVEQPLYRGAATVNPVAVGIHTTLPARNAKTWSATLSCERFPRIREI